MQKINFILEGVDRLGKGTLISNLQHKFGFYNIIHYEKPKELKCFTKGDKELNKALEHYQRESFQSGFKLLLKSQEPFIMDRFHLGEYVYSNRYRGYDGSYVFDMEKKEIKIWEDFHGGNAVIPVKLILLTTSDFSFIKDDGLSFDFEKKEEEQQDFIIAYHASKLPKVMIDVSNGKGGYKTPAKILKEALK